MAPRQMRNILRELGNDTYEVLWKVPAIGSNRRPDAFVQFPADTENLSEPRAFISDGAWIERWQIAVDTP